jgi:hypothetical protein
VTSGFDDFKGVLKDFRTLSVWAVGAGSAPFVGALASLAPPPWPKQITTITAVLDLVVLILVFQFFNSATKKLVNWAMAFTALVLVVVAFSYLSIFGRYTFQIPGDGRDVKGFVYTTAAKRVYGEHPDNTDKILTEMEYDGARLWESWSINRMTTVLQTLWLLSFAALSGVIGIFIVFQRGQSTISRTSKHP